MWVGMHQRKHCKFADDDDDDAEANTAGKSRTSSATLRIPFAIERVVVAASSKRTAYIHVRC